MRVFIETHGCSANLNNAEIMKGLLAKKHKIVSSEKDADLVILNTCVVKGPTRNKMIGRMQEIKKKLIITGCMPGAELETIQRLKPGAVCVGINSIKRIEEAISAGKNILDKEKEIKLGTKKVNENKLIDIIQISEGCLGNCSYCLTKLAKGNLFSYPEEKIIEEVKKSKSREIWLTSQDCAAYGLDKKTNLVNLLKKITALNKDIKIRIGMMNPNNILKILNDLTEIYKNPKIFKFLHIPLQSGSNAVLKNMNRFYRANDFKKIINKFRKEIPEIQVMTDIICGFPGETEKQFNDSIKLIKEIRPDAVHVSRYWQMKKTKAAGMKQTAEKTIMERSKTMGGLVRKISAEKNKGLIGWKGKVIFNGEGNKGRDDSYRQVIVKCKSNLTGKETDVEIIDSGTFYLIARLQ
jgi:MiaB-like tRNA modifying enzyme